MNFRCRLPSQVLLGAGLCLSGAVAQAEPTQTITRDLSTPLGISSADNYGNPDALAQAAATAFFSDGSSSRALFSVGGAGNLSGASASTSRFFVSAENGNGSQPDEWRVTNLDATASLVGFTLEGYGDGAGSAAFDVSAFTTPQDTPGSSGGSELRMDFTDRTFIPGSVTITYRRPLSLNGAPVAGDLFGRVDVALNYTVPALGGGLPPSSFSGGIFSSQRFITDLDFVTYAAPVPEPSSVLMMAGGLGLIAAFARRRRRA